MTSIKSIARWWVVFAAIFFILTGLSLLFGITAPAVIMGILALVAGILGLFAS